MYKARAKARCNVYILYYISFPADSDYYFSSPFSARRGGEAYNIRSVHTVHDALLLLYYPDISITIDDARLLYLTPVEAHITRA